MALVAGTAAYCAPANAQDVFVDEATTVLNLLATTPRVTFPIGVTTGSSRSKRVSTSLLLSEATPRLRVTM